VIKNYRKNFFLFTVNLFLFYFLLQLDHRLYVHSFFGYSFYIPFQNYIFALLIFFIFSLIIKKFLVNNCNAFFKITNFFPLIFFFGFILINLFSPQSYVLFTHHFSKSILFYIFVLLITIIIFKNSQKIFYFNLRDKLFLFLLFFFKVFFLSTFLLIDDYSFYFYQSSLNFSAAVSSIVNGLMNLGAGIHFENQYGSYSIFLSPLIKLIFGESLSIFNISIFFSFIFFISLILIFFVVYFTTKNFLLSYFTSFGLVFFKTILVGQFIKELYLADTVIRFFPVAVTIFLIFINLRFNLIFLNIISANIIFLMIFWSTENGVFCFLSFLFSYFVINIFKKNFKSLIIFNVLLIITLPVNYYLLQLYVNFFFGESINLRLVFDAVFMYAGLPDIYNLKDLTNFSILIVLILLSNLYFSIQNFLTKKITFLNELCFSLSILGLAVFSYYISRAVHLQCSVTSGYISYILLSINVNKFLNVNNTRTIKNKFFQHLKFFSIFFWIAFVIGFFVSFSDNQKLGITRNFIDYLISENFKVKYSYVLNYEQIKLSDILSGKKNKPEWIQKTEYLKKLFLNNQDEKKKLFISQNDFYYNLVFKNSTPVIRTNFAHMQSFCDYKNLFEKVSKKELDYIIVDSNTEPIMNAYLLIQFLDFVELNYTKKVVNFDIETDLARQKDLVKAGYLLEQKKEHMTVFIKNDNLNKQYTINVKSMAPICRISGTFRY